MIVACCHGSSLLNNTLNVSDLMNLTSTDNSKSAVLAKRLELQMRTSSVLLILRRFTAIGSKHQKDRMKVSPAP